MKVIINIYKYIYILIYMYACVGIIIIGLFKYIVGIIIKLQL